MHIQLSISISGYHTVTISKLRNSGKWSEIIGVDSPPTSLTVVNARGIAFEYRNMFTVKILLFKADSSAIIRLYSPMKHENSHLTFNLKLLFKQKSSLAIVFPPTLEVLDSKPNFSHIKRLRAEYKACLYGCRFIGHVNLRVKFRRTCQEMPGGQP